MSRIQRFAQVLLLFSVALALWSTLLKDAQSRSCFIDELFSVESAASVFSNGRYELEVLPHPPRDDGTLLGKWYSLTNGSFTAGQSIGPISNLFSGVSWRVFGSLWSVRLASQLYHLVLLGCIAWALRCRFQLGRMETATGILSLALLTLLAVTYSEASINHSLGETPAALWLMLGVVLGWGQAPLRQGVAAFLIGCGVWLGKWIFLPLGGLLLLVLFLTRKEERLKRAFALGLGFSAPLLVWFLWIVLLAGPETWIEWIQGRLSFLKYGNSGFDSKAQGIRGLLNRLNSPLLEWASYEWKVKLRIVALLLLPPLCLMGFGWRTKQREFKIQLALLASGSLVFAYWYFFLHPSMWVRHLQPALLYGWMIIAALTFVSWTRWDARKRWITLSVFAFALSLWQLRKSDVREGLTFAVKGPREQSYVSQCHRSSEDPTLPPKSTPGCACEGKVWERAERKSL